MCKHFPLLLVSSRFFLFLLCLPLFISACGGSKNSKNTESQIAVAEISFAGGAITSSDGQVSLTIPEGALSSATEISIRRLANVQLPDEFDGMNIFAAYELLLSGLTFAANI